MNDDIIGLNYFSLYIKDFEEAKEYYSKIFGPPKYIKEKTYGWPMGNTWLTIFPSEYGTNKNTNPCNTEFAIHVASSEAVDRLYIKFIAAGAISYNDPEDTEMYEPMRYACIDDPFGVRVDIYCPK